MGSSWNKLDFDNVGLSLNSLPFSKSFLIRSMSTVHFQRGDNTKPKSEPCFKLSGENSPESEKVT